MPTDQIKKTADAVANFMKLDNSQPALSFMAMGAIVVGLTATLSNSFEIPAKYVALIISALMASMAVDVKKNLANFLLTSLVVFHVARGGNATGGQIEEMLKSPPAAEQTSSGSIFDLLSPSAKAESITSNVDTNRYYFSEYFTPGENSVNTGRVFRPW